MTAKRVRGESARLNESSSLSEEGLAWVVHRVNCLLRTHIYLNENKRQLIQLIERYMMHNYIRWISIQAAEAAAVMKDDGRSCGSCRDCDMTDWAPCNACSRSWGSTGIRINWAPTPLPESSLTSRGPKSASLPAFLEPAMASGIEYVPCPNCGEPALELVNFRLMTVSVECDHCGYTELPIKAADEPDREQSPVMG